MRVLFVLLTSSALFLSGCSSKKNTSSTTLISSSSVRAQSLPDSIDGAISAIDQRLDIKMKRKTYTLKPGVMVTLQKWFEYGDTTRLVKLREEILTKDIKMEVIQYHFLGNKLAEIHDYLYDKKCDGNQKQCMNEAKYYFGHDTLALAMKRQTQGRIDSVPVIERAAFQPFQPSRTFLASQLTKLDQINKKYTTLAYPKPRPEQGTSAKNR